MAGHYGVDKDTHNIIFSLIRKKAKTWVLEAQNCESNCLETNDEWQFFYEWDEDC